MRRTLLYVMLAPRNACVAILIAYRAVISPLYGDVCRYYPSCSHYTMQAIQHHGVVRGVWLGTRRLARCHPWAEGGIDDIPVSVHAHIQVNRFGFAIPGVTTVTSKDRPDHSVSALNPVFTESFATSHGKG